MIKGISWRQIKTQATVRVWLRVENMNLLCHQSLTSFNNYYERERTWETCACGFLMVGIAKSAKLGESV